MIRSPTTPIAGGSQPDLSKLSNMETDSLITFRKRKQPAHDCDCPHEIKEIKCELARMTSILEKYVTSNQLIMNKIQESITEVKTEITEMKSTHEKTINLLHENINEARAQVNEIKSVSSNIATEQNVIKNHMTLLENKISMGENKLITMQSELGNKPTTTTLSQSISQPCIDERMIRELKERNEREKNIIIIGIPEQTTIPVDQRIANDEAAVISITSSIKNDNTKPLKVIRIGKLQEGKNRLLKVCYNEPHTAKLLLRNKNKLPENIKMISDQTPAQQKYLQGLKEELQRRQANGESDLTIKYINGVPNILQVPPKNSNR